MDSPTSMHEHPAVQRAIEYGIDITLLRGGPRPADRLREVDSWLGFLHGFGRSQAGAPIGPTLQEIGAEGIDYVLVGSTAAYLRGSSRIPFSLDICCLPEVSAALAQLVQDRGDARPCHEVPGVGGYQACLAQSTLLSFDGFSVRVLALSALIAAERAGGRDREQLLILEALQALGGD